MIPDSFHVCQSIDSRLSWTKDGKDLAHTFGINALNPNRVMGSHIQMLCKQYGMRDAAGDPVLPGRSGTRCVRHCTRLFGAGLSRPYASRGGRSCRISVAHGVAG